LIGRRALQRTSRGKRNRNRAAPNNDLLAMGAGVYLGIHERLTAHLQ
jgi:hypothetical protein